MNLSEAFLIYSVIVEGKDMTVMENQHESGKIIPKKGIVNTRWFLGKLTEITALLEKVVLRHFFFF